MGYPSFFQNIAQKVSDKDVFLVQEGDIIYAEDKLLQRVVLIKTYSAINHPDQQYILEMLQDGHKLNEDDVVLEFYDDTGIIILFPFFNGDKVKTVKNDFHEEAMLVLYPIEN